MSNNSTEAADRPISDRLDEIQTRAGRVCRCDDEECFADLVQLADKDVPGLIAEVKRLTGLLGLALEHLEACPAPDIAHGWDLCPHGEKWPCKTTRAAWQLRGLDPDQQIVTVLDGVMQTWTQEAAGA